MTLEEALEKSGTANLVDEKTLQATKELIEPDEEILYALYTKVGDMNMFETASSNLMIETDGIVIITNNRIIFFKKQKWDIDTIMEIKITDIKNIGQQGFSVTKSGYLQILTYMYRWRIVVYKEQLDGMKSAIKSAQNMIKE